MKLIISGKGGSGKSTIAALLAKQNVHDGKRVVVVDIDVSSVLGPHRLLGMDMPHDLIEYFNGEKAVKERLKALRQSEASPETPMLGTWTYDTVPKAYSAINDRLQLVSIGKIKDATIGCKSPWMWLARQFILGLDLAENDRLIIDAEAGIEHFGRGIDKLCDAILMVVDPSYESIRLAQRASGMADEVNVPLYFVLNKTNTNTSRSMRNTLAARNPIIGEFPMDPDLMAVGLGGGALPQEYPPAAALLENLMSRRRSS